jgi:hypothetical protein
MCICRLRATGQAPVGTGLSNFTFHKEGVRWDNSESRSQRLAGTNAQAFVARGLEMVRRGRPRKTIQIEPSEWAFIDEPVHKRNYGKSESIPGRYCGSCREFLSGIPAPCPHCDGAP